MPNSCICRIRQTQAGVATIELSLTLLILLMMVFGIVSYGALFWAQQSLTSVATDTARHGLLQSYADPDGLPAPETIEAYACNAARQTAVLRVFDSSRSCGAGSGFARVAIQESCAAGPDRRCLNVSLTLAVNSWPLLNTMRSFAGMLTSNPGAWVPEELHAVAVVIIAPSGG